MTVATAPITTDEIDGHDPDLAQTATGGPEARWGQDFEAPVITGVLYVGMRVDAFVLSEIAAMDGVNAAALVDALSFPCEVCGLSTFGGGICRDCEQGVGQQFHYLRSETDAELAGAFSPRCDF